MTLTSSSIHTMIAPSVLLVKVSRAVIWLNSAVFMDKNIHILSHPVKSA
jgi:hypothetical protein